jgi:flagellar hook assembly protein FlgD
MLGQVVNVLVDNHLNAGYHSVNWNSTNMTRSKMVSGVYFSELKAIGSNGQEFYDLKKMILLK